MKKIISIVFITIICLIFVPNKNLAVLQSNGNTPAKYTLNDYLVNVRKMENLGGAMGLTETLNEDLTSTTSNNIDVHLERNTEYGAMAILSASSYGNPNIIGEGETTTGNKTGIVINLNNEVTSVQGYENYPSGSNLVKASNRYKDRYFERPYVKKYGDALIETKNWHGASNGEFFNDGIYTAEDVGAMIRACGKSIFEYNAYRYGIAGYPHGPTVLFPYASRAVVVCGQGL